MASSQKRLAELRPRGRLASGAGRRRVAHRPGVDGSVADSRSRPWKTASSTSPLSAAPTLPCACAPCAASSVMGGRRREHMRHRVDCRAERAALGPWLPIWSWPRQAKLASRSPRRRSPPTCARRPRRRLSWRGEPGDSRAARDPTHYIWGFDNASPPYRVQVQAVMANACWSRCSDCRRTRRTGLCRGRWSRFLPWSPRLPNGETVAELAGHLGKVAVSYNPDDQTSSSSRRRCRRDSASSGAIAATAPISSMAQRSMTTSSCDVEPRRRSGDRTPPSQIAEGELGNTGLDVDSSMARCAPTISGSSPRVRLRPSWWSDGCSKRPAAHPSVGLKRSAHTLGLVEWTTEGDEVTGVLIHDCRPPFLPLTKIRALLRRVGRRLAHQQFRPVASPSMRRSPRCLRRVARVRAAWHLHRVGADRGSLEHHRPWLRTALTHRRADHRRGVVARGTHRDGA